MAFICPKNQTLPCGGEHPLKVLFLLLFLGIMGFRPDSLLAQADPAPFECGMCCTSEESSGEFGANCAKTSSLWSSNARHIPRTDAKPIYVRANFIILRKSDDPDPDVQGNFSQDNPEHMAFLNAIIDLCNHRLANLYGTTDCADPRTEAKIQIVPNFIFLKDEYAWNADNTPGSINFNHKCPSQNQTAWHLANLSNQINSDPNIPAGINVFFPIQGDIYNRLVILGTINRPDQESGYCRWWCSEHPSSSNLSRTSNISLTNLYMKYRWFQLQPGVTGFPFEPTGREILEWEAANSLPHEFAHSFIEWYVHWNACSNHLLSSVGPSTRDVLRAIDVGTMHRNLAISNLRQFVDCTETYNTPGSNASDRIVDVSETWDLNMRLYTNVVVKAGATLTLTCDLLMPFDGTITVERGAKLIVDGGTVRRANTCSPSQFWRGIAVQGNSSLPQPDPNGVLSSNQAGVVLLKGDGMIEGAIIGATAKGHAIWDDPTLRGGLIQATDFTFRDCRKGAEFMKYDLVNFSKFDDVLFERTGTGSMHTGVSIWDTDGILFERCTFNNVATTGIVGWDAAFNVKKRNLFKGAELGILSGGSTPLSGQVKVGELGNQLNDRNKFEDNIVGIHATSNSWVEIMSNDFSNFHFDVAVNGTTRSDVWDNYFASGTAGSQFENTGNNANTNRCNQYQGNSVGTNIVGKNTGFTFREEDFSTDFHDLFIEGPPGNAGEIPMLNGNNGAALWNYFSFNKPENIKTSTVVPNNNTVHFFYFHPDPMLNNRVRPRCALNGMCMPQSNFTNIQTLGVSQGCSSGGGGQEPCQTEACLDALRADIAQKTAQHATNPTPELEAELQHLTTERERITSVLVEEYRAQNDWASIETLLTGDLNPYNHRRLVGAKMEQGQFAAASGLLQSFPQATNEDQLFVQVQNINVARLSDPEFELSQVQEAILLDMATSPSPEAGYAQSLLGILKGQIFMPKLPDLGGDREGFQTERPSLLETMQLSPNPVSDVLQVQVPHWDGKKSRVLEMRELSTGRLVKGIPMLDGGDIAIPVEALPSGLYLLILQEKGIAIDRQKVVVQH